MLQAVLVKLKINKTSFSKERRTTNMKKYGYKKLDNGWRIKIGGTNGEAFEFYLRHFKKEGFRLTICFNTDRLIKIFGFNQRTYGI